MTALLYALRDSFAENPRAPPVINGIEFALHFKEDNPRPMCRKLPRLSIKEKEHMSKDALQMLINDVIEFSDGVQSAYKAEQHTVSKLGSTVKRLEDKLFNGCEAQLL